MLQLDARNQPVIVVIGPTLQTITNHLIVIDGSRYSMTSVLQSIDVLFKCFQATLALYPVESKHVWLIIQKGLYGIQTQWDETIPSVETFLTDLN